MCTDCFRKGYERKAPLSRSSSFWKIASDSVTSMLLLRGTAMPPTGYHLLGSPPSGTSRIETMYSGEPLRLSASKSSAALSRFTAPWLLGFGAAFFFGASLGGPKPLAIATTASGCVDGARSRPGEPGTKAAASVTAQLAKASISSHQVEVTATRPSIVTNAHRV